MAKCETPASDDPHERAAARAHTPAFARGKRASALPRQVLAQIVQRGRLAEGGADDRIHAEAVVSGEPGQTLARDEGRVHAPGCL